MCVLLSVNRSGWNKKNLRAVDGVLQLDRLAVVDSLSLAFGSDTDDIAVGLRASTSPPAPSDYSRRTVFLGPAFVGLGTRKHNMLSSVSSDTNRPTLEASNVVRDSAYQLAVTPVSLPFRLRLAPTRIRLLTSTVDWLFTARLRTRSHGIGTELVSLVACPQDSCRTASVQ